MANYKTEGWITENDAVGFCALKNYMLYGCTFYTVIKPGSYLFDTVSIVLVCQRLS